MRCERVRQARATGLMEWPNTNKLVLTPQMRSMDWPTLKEKLLKQKIKKKNYIYSRLSLTTTELLKAQKIKLI